MQYRKKIMKTETFCPRKSLGIMKAVTYRIVGYGFMIDEYLLENGRFEKYGSYNSTHIEDIAHEIKSLKIS